MATNLVHVTWSLSQKRYITPSFLNNTSLLFNKSDYCDSMMAIIMPYSPIASAKMRIKIIPTKILPSIAFIRTPTSPTMPMASPAANELNPTQMPLAKCLYPFSCE